MGQSLMKVQIGPVQEFIAQARSTRDMWAGSYLLAWLTASAMKVFKDAKCEFVFPTLDDQPLYKMFCDMSSDEELIPTLPNVFMMLVPHGEEKETADQARAALKEELRKIGDACWKKMEKQGAHGKKDWKNRWDEQIEAFPILNWHAVPISNDWKTDVQLLGIEMAARRNTRDFEQWGVSFNEKKELRFDCSLKGASKDVLSGKEEIIGDEDFWTRNKELWKGAGPFGAMNCIKRLFPSEVLEKRFGDRKSFWENMSVTNTRDLAARNKEGESDAKDENGELKPKNPYMAVIAMDGDRMGAALKEIATREKHTEFSQTLARFPEQEVKPLVDHAGGQLVYAGGDDVLVLVPADAALDLAEKLHDKFLEVMKAFRKLDPEKPLDASCGIAVGHYKFPLQRIVEEARHAESRAKNKRGRAAFEISLLKRSGEIIQWGGKWEGKALPVYQDFTAKSEGEHTVFSGRFPYALAELLQPYRLGKDSESGVDLKAIIEKEFLHIVDRQSGGKVKEWPEAVGYLKNLDDGNLVDFPNLFLASAFMNRQRGEG